MAAYTKCPRGWECARLVPPDGHRCAPPDGQIRDWRSTGITWHSNGRRPHLSMTTVQGMRTTMRAAVCVRAGGPEVLEIRELPVPAVRQGWSLVRVMGAGLNRSELRTRQGHSPGVRFPRVLGIECVGIVAASTDPTLPDGTTVAAVMGEMGREFDGGYAEFALLPNSLLMPVVTTLPWGALAALPETYLTA